MNTLQISCNNSNITGKVTLPASKSLSNRALIIQALSPKEINLINLSTADDTILLGTLLNLISKKDKVPAETVLNCENAGTVYRFLTAFLTIQTGNWILTGSQRMKERPVGELVNGLNKIGAVIQYMEKPGYPPLSISGKTIHGGDLSIHAGISSQFISALLMIAPVLERGINLELKGTIGSRPYIDMTLGVLHHFGIQSNFTENVISISPQPIIPRPFHIEADWSSAAFWYELVALAENAEVILEGLQKDSLQGDAVLPTLFEPLGVSTAYTENGVLIRKKKIKRTYFDLDFRHYPDLAQAVVCTCAGLGLGGRFTGLASLRIKEADRLQALQEELSKTGAKIELKGNDELLLHTTSRSVTSPTGAFNPHGDHRTAMALAPLALVTKSVLIHDSQVVSKSYPGFWDDLQKGGFNISQIQGKR